MPGYTVDRVKSLVWARSSTEKVSMVVSIRPASAAISSAGVPGGIGRSGRPMEGELHAKLAAAVAIGAP